MRYVDEVRQNLTVLAGQVADGANAAQAAAAEAKQAAAQAQELFRRLSPPERYQALVNGAYSTAVVEAALAAAAAAAASTASATDASTSTAAATAAPPINHTLPPVCVICLEACALLVSMCPEGHSQGTPHTVCLECVHGVLKANSDDSNDDGVHTGDWNRTGVRCPMCMADAGAPAGCVREEDVARGEKRRIFTDLYVYTAAGERRTFSDVDDSGAAFEAAATQAAAHGDTAGAGSADSDSDSDTGDSEEPFEPRAAGAPPPSEAEAVDSEWACPKCTLINPPLAPVCAVCDYRRHGAGPTEGRTEARGEQPPPRRVRQRTDGHIYQHTQVDVVGAVRELYGVHVANITDATIMDIYERLIDGRSREQLGDTDAFGDIIESMATQLMQ
jgi:hypothetical protein